MGSLGATAFTQINGTSSALQGEVSANTNTSIAVPFGVLGEYDATGSTFGIGIAGISTTGYGVGGESLDANAGVLALNAGGGNGLEAYARGMSFFSNAILAENVGAGPGLTATGDANDGVDGVTTGNGHSGVFGNDISSQGGFGIIGSSPSGNGVYGISFSSTAVLALGESGSSTIPVIQAVSDKSGTDLFGTTVYGTDSNPYETTALTYPSGNLSGTVIDGVGASNDLRVNGDVIITGEVYSGCTNFPQPMATDCPGAVQTVSPTSTGALVREYSGKQTSATIEDAGEAQLTNGYAHVALDPAFASAIATRQPYLVFTTPQGDGPGLFVSRRTATGFDVRQSLGGRSNIAFDYRILAHPYGASGERIAIVSPHVRQLTPLAGKLASRLRAIVRTSREPHAIRHVVPHELVRVKAAATR